MKLRAKETGWVIFSNEGTFMLEYTYARLRKDAIKKWMDIWDTPKTWATFKRQGYKCMKASRTIEAE